ncbi:MAG: preprotein translocase subunit SecG [Paludibacter sp.]|jgi:preprotein translocase subunit SecG|nr:preprotein translocase subunit SecG [Paludibacter sp.]
MYTFLIVLTIAVSILLVFVVLIQNSKGGGLAANFAAGNQIFGVRQTADTLEKATWYLSITLGLLCVLATVFPPISRGEMNSSTVQRNNELFHNPSAQPGFGIEQTQPAGDQTQPAEETQPQQQETPTE